MMKNCQNWIPCDGLMVNGVHCSRCDLNSDHANHICCWTFLYYCNSRKKNCQNHKITIIISHSNRYLFIIFLFCWVYSGFDKASVGAIQMLMVWMIWFSLMMAFITYETWQSHSFSSCVWWGQACWNSTLQGSHLHDLISNASHAMLSLHYFLQFLAHNCQFSHS